MRILLADDQSNIRSALRLLLEQEDNVTITEEAGDCREMMATIATCHPDLILLDWELPGCKSEELIPGLRGKCPELIIVALSSQPEARRKALDSGADDFVSKGGPPQEVIEAVTKFKHGRKGEPR